MLVITTMTKKLMIMMMTANGWKYCWVQSSRSKALATGNVSTATREAIGHHFVITRKREVGQKRLVLWLRPALRKQGPSAVTAVRPVTQRATAGKNTHTQSQERVP